MDEELKAEGEIQGPSPISRLRLEIRLRMTVLLWGEGIDLSLRSRFGKDVRRTTYDVGKKKEIGRKRPIIPPPSTLIHLPSSL